jgi:hypothetical protein
MKERRAHWSVVRKLGAFAKIESYVLQPQFIKLGSVGVELSAARLMIGEERSGEEEEERRGEERRGEERRGGAERRGEEGDDLSSGSGGEGGWSGGEGAEDGVLNLRLPLQPGHRRVNPSRAEQRRRSMGGEDGRKEMY